MRVFFIEPGQSRTELIKYVKQLKSKKNETKKIVQKELPPEQRR